MNANYQLIDLTHPLNPQAPTWSGVCGFKKIITADYTDTRGPSHFQVQRIEMHTGIGTHIDAPLHCVEGGIGVSDILLTHLVAPLVVLDVSACAHADYQLEMSDVDLFEKTQGKIPPQCLVVIYTGWARHWNDTLQYRNADIR